VGIIFLRSKLKAYLNMELSELKDPMKKGRDVKDIGHASKEEYHNIFNVYVNADGSSIDTANNYNEGTSENILVNL